MNDLDSIADYYLKRPIRWIVVEFLFLGAIVVSSTGFGGVGFQFVGIILMILALLDIKEEADSDNLHDYSYLLVGMGSYGLVLQVGVCMAALPSLLGNGISSLFMN